MGATLRPLPDEGAPHVRFDERGVETERLKRRLVTNVKPVEYMVPRGHGDRSIYHPKDPRSRHSWTRLAASFLMIIWVVK